MSNRSHGNALPGLGVRVHGYEADDDLPRVAARVVQDLVRSGVSHEDMVLLSCRGAGSSRFARVKQVGGLPLRRFTGEYDGDGNQVFTGGRLAFDSIYRFKGQEAPAVVVVEVDPRADRLALEQRLLYCATTRATVRLDLVVRADNPENRSLQEHACW